MQRAIISIPPRHDNLLARAAVTKLRAAATGREVEDVCKTMRGGDDVLRVITRESVDPATTGGSHWADDLVGTDFGDYLGWLAKDSAAARVMAMGLTVPMRRGEFKAPTRDTAPATLPWCGEANPIAVRDATFQTLTLQPRKFGAISVLSREVAKFGAASVMTAVLREDGSKSLDAAMFSATGGDDEVHAGLLAGLTPIVGYPGGDKEAFEADVSALLAVVAPNGSGNFAIVTGQLLAQKIGLRFPNFKIPVFSTSAVADTRLILVDGGALVNAFGDFDIEIVNNATVHMADPALELASETGPTFADPVRSLFQTDAWGIRILGDLAFAGRKTNVAAYVDNPTW